MMVDYTKCFSHADDVIGHLNTVVHDIQDDLLVQKYVGFVSVLAVTVYELAIKDIFVGFATKQHREFGIFVEASLAKINGRIQVDAITKERIPKFGHEYKVRFKENIKYLQKNRPGAKEYYDSVILARNNFVHAGDIRPKNIHSNFTYEEIVKAYEDGKEVIHCLAETMVRQK